MAEFGVRGRQGGWNQSRGFGERMYGVGRNPNYQSKMRVRNS